ncbi:MAG: FlgD immunoglobulin-like domain containing protein, partial [candidate division Zixibacteria bacterium]
TVGAITFGWDWDDPNLQMDSAFAFGDFLAMDVGPFFYLNNDLAITNDSQLALCGAFCVLTCFPPDASGWRHIATYYMTMLNWTGASSLTIDTIEILPDFGSTEYGFVPLIGGLSGLTYQPIWGGPIIISGTAVVEQIPGELPSSFQLNQNFPNPFNPSTTISFDLPTRSKVTLKVFNLLGQEVSTLIDKDLPANSYKVEWDGRSESGAPVASGIYFYKLIAEADNNAFVETKKMMLLK